MKFCRYCGTEISDDATFCTKCGKAQEAVHSLATTEEAQIKKYKNGILAIGILLCVLFFSVEIAQSCTGFGIATGGLTSGNNQYTFVEGPTFLAPIFAWLLFISSALLVIQSFLNKTFKVLRKISIMGSSSQVALIIVLYTARSSNMINSMFGMRGSSLTPSYMIWLILAMYIILWIYTHRWIRLEEIKTNDTYRNK